jgi:RNA polymerase sigma-70 factor (ECF subfamily)
VLAGAAGRAVASTVSAIDVCLDVPWGAGPRFVLGIDEPLYLSLHGPGADVAPPDGSLVSLLRYHRDGEVDDPERTSARLEAMLDAVRPGWRDHVVHRRFRRRAVVTADVPGAASGGLAGRTPVTGSGVPGVLVAGDWVGPSGMLADAAVASGEDAGRRAAVAAAAGAGGRMSATASFEQHRLHLFDVAYRMLGSVAEAEDIVQEAWLRWAQAERDGVDDARAFLTTVVSRLAIDRLRSAQRRRETYVGPWLPEPLPTWTTPRGGDALGPEDAADLADSLTFAFLTMLDQLHPDERAVLLLHDVFGYQFGEVAAMVGRSEAACRQLASRARRRLRRVDEDRLAPARTRPPVEHVDRFLAALAVGDVPEVLAVLAPDVVLVSDGGPDHHAPDARCEAPTASVGCSSTWRPGCRLGRRWRCGRSTASPASSCRSPASRSPRSASPAVRTASTGSGSCATRPSWPTCSPEGVAAPQGPATRLRWSRGKMGERRIG